MNVRKLFGLGIVVLAMLALASVTNAQAPTPRAPRAPRADLGTGFTYQGQLKQSGAAYTGTCDLQFSLWDDLSAGAQKGLAQTELNVSVANGLFTTILNSRNEFGAMAFDGNARWLAIAVRCPAGSGSYTTLTPRQELTAAPYALTALKTAYKNVLVVAKSGGHYNTISAALTSITDNSASNRYLIWIAPGTYTETVTMKQYVDIEGAGELATKITYTGNAGFSTGTVIGADNAELRLLTVENTGGDSYAFAIYINLTSPRLTHITANASGGTTSSRGISAIASFSMMTNVTATGSGGTHGYGVYNWTSLPTMANVTATGSGVANSYGVYNTASSAPTMTNVTATASGGANSYGVYNDTSTPTMTNVTATASGGANSYGVYNNTSAPTMTNMTVRASGGTIHYGMLNDNSSPTMTNVTVTASGGTFSTGVANANSSAPTMTNGRVTASGGTTNYGIYNSSSSPTFQNSTINASGGTNNYGISNLANSGTYTVTVNNSQITGSSNTIQNDNEFTVRIGASKLDGGAVILFGGTITCAGVYDENYTFYASSCP